MPLEVGEMPNVPAVPEKANWTEEKAERLFFKFIHPAVSKDAEQSGVKQSMVGWLLDKHDWLEDDELKEFFKLAEFDSLNTNALNKLKEATLKELAIEPEKFGVRISNWGWKWTKLREADESDDLDANVETVLEYQKRIQDAKNKLAKTKKEMLDRTRDKMSTVDAEKKQKRQENAIVRLQDTLEALREKNYDNSITLGQAVNNIKDAEGFYSILSLSPEVKSEAAKALAIVTDKDVLPFESDPKKFEELYNIPLKEYLDAKGKYGEGLIELQGNKAERLIGDISERTMKIAFENRDKDKFPTDQSFSGYLHGLTDREWMMYFSRLINEYTRQINESLPEGLTITDKEMEVPLDEPRERRGKGDKETVTTKPVRDFKTGGTSIEDVEHPRPEQVGGTYQGTGELYSNVPSSEKEEFLQRNTPFDKKELLSILQNEEISISQRKKSLIRDNKYKLFLTSSMTLNWINEFSTKIGAKSTEAVTQLKKQNPITGNVRISEYNIIPDAVLELLPGVAHKQTYDNLVRNMKDFSRRSRTTLQDSLETKVDKNTNLYWQSIDVSLDMLENLSEVDNIESVINLSNFDKDYWEKFDTIDKFRNYILGLAVAGSGERQLVDNLDGLLMSINSFCDYL